MAIEAAQATSSRVRFAPGMRVEIRDAEWRIKRVDHSSDGGYVLSCDGLSELVSGRESIFLNKLEDIRILDPKHTTLVADTSSNFDASLLFIDAQLRRSVPSDERLHQGHRAALDSMAFQLQPALQALAQPRQRILIADAVGLGKTLEAGILVSELIARGRGKRILVLATKSMLGQFQQEFWNRFTIPLTRLDSVGLQRVRSRIPANHNPFHYFDRSIISIDTLKQDIEYRHHLEQAYWDIIIIDEAHNVADRGSRSQRARLARLLATRSDTLIMLSATPHDGKPQSFASLVNMLDPTAIANPDDYAEQDYRDKGLVIRRFKQDVRAELAGNFPDCEIETARIAATSAEENAYARLAEVSFHNLDGRGQGVGQLFRTTLEKALFSSPAACLSTVNNRIDRLQKRLPRVRDDERQTTLIEDIDTLIDLQAALEAITPAQFSKYQLLQDVIHNQLGWTGKDADDRLVIFTESLVTLDFLAEHLPRALKLKKNQVAKLRGDARDSDLMDTVEAFNNREAPIRLLLCSDVAAEGINLHHLSHRMIHFDIPWSLMVFQQRNGRIDRYGQTRQPQIRYLLTETTHERIRGDQRVLEVLIAKDEQTSKNIGDPSEFLGLYDADAETEVVAEQMERNDGGFDIAGAFAALMDDTAGDSENPLATFTPEPPATAAVQGIQTLPGIFAQGLDYAKSAIRWLRASGVTLDAEIDPARQTLALTAPVDLKQRLHYLAAEVRPEHDRFVLTSDIEQISAAIRRSRQEEGSAWPALHYLWPLHPVMEWLTDRALNAFGRHTAPVLALPGKLQAGEHIVLIHGGFPNRRGQLLIHDWVGIRLQGSEVIEHVDWPDVQQRLDLHPGQLPNRGLDIDTTALQTLLAPAVDAAYRHLMARKVTFEAEHQPRLAARQQRLDDLKHQHEQYLQRQLDESRQQETLKARRRDEKQQHIDRIFDDYRSWLDNTQTAGDEPYLQVVAVFSGGNA